MTLHRPRFEQYPRSRTIEPGGGTLFRSITGILMYLANDRPDVQYTVNELACAMAKPTRQALEAAKHLVRYLLKTKDFGIFFSKHLGGYGISSPCGLTVTGQGTSRRRRSRTAVHLCWGDCLLYSYTRRQTSWHSHLLRQSCMLLQAVSVKVSC